MLVLGGMLVLCCAAQEVGAVSVYSLPFSLSRTNGYALGDDIAGQFVLSVNGPSNLTLVQVLFNGTVVHNETKGSFSWAFNTGSYPVGLVNITVIEHDSELNIYQSNQTWDFVPPGTGNDIAIIAIVIAIVLVAVLIPVKVIRQRKKSGASSIDL